MTLVYIKASSKQTEAFWILKMAEYFLVGFRSSHPDEQVTALTRSADNIPFLDEQDLTDKIVRGEGSFSPIVDQFLAHDF